MSDSISHFFLWRLNRHVLSMTSELNRVESRASRRNDHANQKRQHPDVTDEKKSTRGCREFSPHVEDAFSRWIISVAIAGSILLSHESVGSGSFLGDVNNS